MKSVPYKLGFVRVCPASVFELQASDYSVAACHPTGVFHSSEIQDVRNCNILHQYKLNLCVTQVYSILGTHFPLASKVSS